MWKGFTLTMMFINNQSSIGKLIFMFFYNIVHHHMGMDEPKNITVLKETMSRIKNKIWK